MTKLAYLVSCYPKLSEAFILREVGYLRDRGFDIRVASINNPDRSADELTDAERAEASRAYYVKARGISGAFAALVMTLLARPRRTLAGLGEALRLAGTDPTRLLYNLFYFVEALLVGRWMQRNGLDHLHVHFATPASTVALIAQRIFPITFSITVHGPDEFYAVEAYHLREKICAAAFVCCIGRFARSQLMRLVPVDQWTKFEVTPLGVDPEAFAPRPFRQSPAPFEILCVGRLVPAKGQHVLVSAVHRLLRARRDVLLRVVGDGPDRNALEREVKRRGIEDQVIFEGGVNQDRIRELYSSADAFALASFAEGIPVVLMEAMAMEVPCVTTRITGIPELIRDEKDGLLVTPSDDEELATALGRLMDDPALRRRLGRDGRRRVLASYDLNENVERLARVFRRRIDRSEIPDNVVPIAFDLGVADTVGARSGKEAWG